MGMAAPGKLAMQGRSRHIGKAFQGKAYRQGMEKQDK